MNLPKLVYFGEYLGMYSHSSCVHDRLSTVSLTAQTEHEAAKIILQAVLPCPSKTHFTSFSEFDTQ